MKKRLSMLLLTLGMLLGSYKGYLALWEDCGPPSRVFPCPVRSLPDADQAALEKGIPISDETELARRLEDFLS